MDEENVFPKGQSYSIDNDAMTRLQRPDMQFRFRYVHCFSSHQFHQFQEQAHTGTSTWLYLSECTGNQFFSNVVRRS